MARNANIRIKFDNYKKKGKFTATEYSSALRHRCYTPVTFRGILY